MCEARDIYRVGIGFERIFVCAPEHHWIVERPTQACFAACPESLAGLWCPCQPRVSRSDESATVYTIPTGTEIEDFTKLAEMYVRAVIALRLIGWSSHTASPRLGPKAQAARWGLGKDDFPEGWTMLGSAE